MDFEHLSSTKLGGHYIDTKTIHWEIPPMNGKKKYTIQLPYIYPIRNWLMMGNRNGGWHFCLKLFSKLTRHDKWSCIVVVILKNHVFLGWADGRNPAPVEDGSLFHDLQGFISPWWLARYLPSTGDDVMTCRLLYHAVRIGKWCDANSISFRQYTHDRSFHWILVD